MLVAVVPLAPVAVGLMGGEGEVARQATMYLRLAALGAPFFMLASAGQGYLRGIEDLRTPLKILIVAHAVNVVLELLFVYGFDWGLAGSAWGTVIAQAGMGAAFVAVQRRAGWQRPEWSKIRPLMRIGAHIAVRTTALLGSFLVASAVLARDLAGGARRPPDRLPAVRVPRARARRAGDRRAGDGRRHARRRRRGRCARGGAAHDRLVGGRRRRCSGSSCSRSAT